MPYLRPSRARTQYTCVGCGAIIHKREPYFRDEPHPRARYLRGAEVRCICAVCVLGVDEATEFLASGGVRDRGDGQLELPFESASEGVLCVPPRVHVIDITPQLVQQLARDPGLMRELPPDRFEDIVFDRLVRMDLDLRRVGGGTYNRDGGIDAIAWPRSSPFPFLLAVQVKHTRFPDRKLGPEPVRELHGVLEAHGFNAGMVVTNTIFTPDAQWFAEQSPTLIHLRDNDDLRRWLRDEFLREYEWRSIPPSIQVCPGVKVSLSP